MTTEAIRLFVDSREIAGWKSVEVVRSLNEAASSFELTCAYGDVPFPVRPDAECLLKAGADVLLTGNLDRIARHRGEDGSTLVLCGRSLTGDLVDCSAINSPGVWRGALVRDIVAALAAEYDVAVSVEATPGAVVVRRHAIEVGETAFEAIERLAALHGLLVTDDASGALVLTRASAATSATTLEAGRNVKAIDLDLDASQLYSEYRCKGQRVATDDDYTTFAESYGVATDSLCQRTRVLVLSPESEADNARCLERATWEAATRLGRAVSLSVVVHGWRQDDGELWAPNLRVRVRDTGLGIDGTFLLHAVTYSQGDDGTTATLGLQPPEAFEPELPAAFAAAPTVSAFAELADGVKVP